VTDGERVVDLLLELRDMPEQRIQIHLDCLVRSTQMFHRNYLELKRHLDYCEKDPGNQDLWHMHAIRKKESLATEAWRLLHNFIASAFALVDHTRVVYRTLNREGEFPEYQERVDASFVSNRLARFVQDLRNYVVHTGGGVLHLEGPIDIKTGHADIQLKLKTNELLRWSGWNAQAKDFITSAGDYIHIADVVREYHATVRDFHIWYGERQREVRSADLERLRHKETKYWLLVLRERLDRFESSPSEAAAGESGLFIGLLDYSDYEELEKLPFRSTERVDLALNKLQERLPLPADLCDRIRVAYQLPGFAPSARDTPSS